MHAIAKALVWIAVAAVVLLVILLPVVIVTGMFGGQRVAGTIALLGLIILALGVAWFVRTRGGTL